MRMSQAPSQPTYKERILAKSRSETAMGATAPAGLRPSGGNFGHIEGFLEELQADEEMPYGGPPRVTSGYGNHIRSQPVVKYYNSLKEELKDLKARMRMAPESTKAELRIDDAWKYYANQLELAKKKDHHIRRTKMATLPSLVHHMRPLSPLKTNKLINVNC